jgi:hypothetical protein
MSDEDDFMSDKFLVQAESSRPGPATYAERRRKEVNRAAERGIVKSRKQREQEAREEALARNMVDDDEKNNKALSMMLKMGFKPGQALGRKRENDAPSPADRSGSRSPAVRIDPIEVEMRQGKHGFFYPFTIDHSSDALPAQVARDSVATVPRRSDGSWTLPSSVQKR